MPSRSRRPGADVDVEKLHMYLTPAEVGGCVALADDVGYLGKQASPRSSAGKGIEHLRVKVNSRLRFRDLSAENDWTLETPDLCWWGIFS